MGETTVEADFGVPADTLWALVRDFGSVPWIPGGDEATVEGEGVGMVRVLAGGAVREQLESLDDSAMCLGYTILQGLPVPVTDYHATMTVQARGAAASRLQWRSRFEPEGISAADAAAQIDALYGMMIGWIREALGDA